ncbi:MAG: amidase, partial [Candidatus Methylumidiphilus sp.]
MSKVATLPFSWSEWGQIEALDIAAHVRGGEVSATEVAEQACAAIRLVDPELDACLELFTPVEACREDTGDHPALSRLSGVPIVIKDLGSALSGRLQEQGSALFRGHRLPRTDPLLGNLLATGISIVGRSACSELGMAYDTTTDYSGLRSTKNPWNTVFTPGGSSGGSAALVAAGAIPAAHGTDGAGSIRIPAALCGLIGMKVTRGFLPPPWRFNEYANPGMVEGFLTRSVRDTAALLDAGAQAPVLGNSFISQREAAKSFLNALDSATRPLRIGYSSGQWGRRGLPGPVALRTVAEAANQFAADGHYVEEIDDASLLDWEGFWAGFCNFWIGLRPSGWPVDGNEAQASLTPMVRGYLNASRSYGKQAIRIHQDHIKSSCLKLANFFNRFDILLSPAFGTAHTRCNGALSSCSESDFDIFIENFLDAGRYSILANESGLPAISIPYGLDEHGMPQAIQLYASW